MSSPKTIFCDIDGTLVEHTGDIVKNYQDKFYFTNISLSNYF
jgi:FMN phosphatase YigB (HAD superfamily)